MKFSRMFLYPNVFVPQLDGQIFYGLDYSRLTAVKIAQKCIPKVLLANANDFCNSGRCILVLSRVSSVSVLLQFVSVLYVNSG